jgi:hypothetical protein
VSGSAAALVKPGTPGTAVTPLGAIVRDIARAGIAGAIVGLVVAGIGGRVVMRLAAMLVPASVGAFTENGNRIGDLTQSGTAVLLLNGLIFGIVTAPIWVAVSPWIPGTGVRRAVLVIPVALAIGAPALVDGDNRDFVVLGHDPLVVVILLALVAAFGAAFALADEALGRRLPASTGAVRVAYALLAIVGVALVLPVTLFAFLTSPDRAIALVGVALVGVGLATLASWVLRVRGRPQPGWLTIAGRAALLLTLVIGLAGVVPEVIEALGG